MKQQVKMKDIAEAFGVSVATVSRALSDSPAISLERRQAIQKYAKEHDFMPNLLAAELRRSNVHPQKLIGVIIPQFAHYYFSTILAGIERVASENGYRVLVAQSNEEYEREVAICKSFHEYRVCGVIVSQARDTVRYDHFRKLQESNIPMVFYDRICTGLNTSRVVVDDYAAAKNAVLHLIKCGCKRIAFFGTRKNMEIAKNRYNGYIDALSEAGMEAVPELIRDCSNREEAEAETPGLLENHSPDGFFCINDNTAVGVLHSVKRCGLRVPEDVCICGFSNDDFAIACDPMLTTVEQRGEEVGQTAAEILISMAESKIPMDKIEKRIVRTKLIIRGTTR